MSQRAVIIKFKKKVKLNEATGEEMWEQRPDFETIESNVVNVERLWGSLIKEVVIVGETKLVGYNETNVTNDIPAPKVVEKIVYRDVPTQLTEENIIKYLIEKGKTPLSIAKYLDVELDLVKKHTPELVVA